MRHAPEQVLTNIETLSLYGFGNVFANYLVGRSVISSDIENLIIESVILKNINHVLAQVDAAVFANDNVGSDDNITQLPVRVNTVNSEAENRLVVWECPCVAREVYVGVELHKVLLYSVFS